MEEIKQITNTVIVNSGQPIITKGIALVISRGGENIIKKLMPSIPKEIKIMATANVRARGFRRGMNVARLAGCMHRKSLRPLVKVERARNLMLEG